jgi:hypothetical protein
MTTRYAVRLEGPVETVAAHRFALATLPEHFEVLDRGVTDAALVSSGAPAGGARVVVAANPLTAPESETVTIPTMRFASRLFAEHLLRRAQAVRYALIDCVVRLDRVGPSEVPTALLEQLAALRAVAGDALRLTSFTRVRDGYLAQGAFAGREEKVTLTGVPSNSSGPAFSLHAAGEERRLEIEIDDERMARPARLRTFDVAGLAQGPLIHQNSNRLTWLLAHVALSGPVQSGYGNDAWREDLAELNRIGA